MSSDTRTRQAIENFLTNRIEDSPFLLSRYTTDLETQVMTTTDGEAGEAPGTYTDGTNVWGNKRWPYQAGTDPNYGDPPLGFSPAAFVEKVGTTWWDYVGKQSVAVGIDIDSLEGHAETTTTNDADGIEQIIDRLKALDYVTIVRSTGGKGIHVYVFFDEANGLPTAKNHHEHTIVARRTLELISGDIGYDLKSHVDCVGSVFWIWSKSSPADHEGFSVIKKGTKLDGSRLAAITLPTPSVRGSNPTDFETVDLDEDHKRILEAIASQNFYYNIRADMNLIHTHTCAIKAAIEQGLEIRGDFVTNSNGGDPMTANCFMAPQENGVFRVYRFGQSQHEPDWNFKNGKNFCMLNEDVSYQEIVSRNSSSCRGGKYEITPEGAAEIAKSLGKSLAHTAPDDVWAVTTSEGVEFHSKKGGQGDEWVKNGKTFVHKLTPEVRGNLDQRLLRKADDAVRYVTQDGNVRGWFHKLDDGEWLEHKTFADLQCVVDGMFGEFARKARELMISNPHKLVNIPFEQEYPGDRQWNRDAPQLKVTPSVSGGDHPHFDMILDHVGGDLDEAVQASDWCRKANILCGADYLRTWLACLIHHTDQPLPYLFLCGPQNSGKSVFHECTRFLFTHGITSANNSLTSGFNGELEGCFFVYIEERDLGDKRHNSYEKIKEWVTGRDLNIRRLYQQQFTTRNYLHFVQMANNSSHLPLEDGDTRIVAIDVPVLKAPMPKAILEARLEAEAPRFLRTLLNTIVPPPVDRLRVPALRTRTKELMERRAMSPVAAFAKEKVHNIPGTKIEFTKFYSEFKAYCEVSGVQAEAEYAVIQEIMLRSDRFQLGKRKGKTYLINCTFDPDAKERGRIDPNSSGNF
jgi:hypothetical protein